MALSRSGNLRRHGKSFERSDQDESAIDIFEILLATIDAIPRSVIEVAEELRAAEPERFKDTLSRRLESVGYGFSPATASLSRCEPVCTENLSSGVVVVKSAKDGV